MSSDRIFNSNDPTLRTVRLFFTHRRTAFLLISLIITACSLDIAVPFITQRLVDALINLLRQPNGRQMAFPVLLSSAVGILLATMGTRGMRSLYNYQLYKAATRAEDEVKCAALENYLSLHALYHRESNSGQIIGRIDRGGTAVFSVLNDIFGQSLVPPLVTFVGVLISLLLKNYWIALAVSLPLPLYLLTIRRLTGDIYNVEQQVSEDFEEVAKESYDIASNVMTVKKFSREHQEVDRQRGLLWKARGTQYRAERIWAVIENAQTLISTAGRVAVILIGGLLVLKGRCTVGEFVLFVTLQEMAYQPVAQLSIIFPRLRRNMSRAERLFAVIDEKSLIVDRPDAEQLAPLRQSIEFRNVWFRYSDADRWTLKGVNLKIEAGSTIALVGRSGSGKTTFINLLLRMFEPQCGSILIDGKDIRDVTQESLRSQIAVVPQEVDLFSRSVAENISYGRPAASPYEVEEAAKIALAHDFILRMESGYQTVVGERGLKLSGGERQRIGISRAVLRNPQILILDEATSHLDTESEQLIQEATERAVRNRAAFIIAHRLSTILHADKIVVFNEQGIEAAGCHEELLQKSETYRTLYQLHVRGGAPAEMDSAMQPMAALRALASNGD